MNRLSLLLLLLALVALMSPAAGAQQRTGRSDPGATAPVAPGYEHLMTVHPPERLTFDPATGRPTLDLPPEARARAERRRAEALARLAAEPRATRPPGAPVQTERREGILLFFVVDNAYDDPDASPGDGLCRTTFDDCTFRAAIEEANAQPDTQPVEIDFVITFGPPGSFDAATNAWTIWPVTPLPSVTQPELWIEGLTQGGASCGNLAGGVPHDLNVVLKGTGLAGYGLFSLAPNFTVRGLVIQDFDGEGLGVFGDNPVVECNYVGTDVTGEVAAGNGNGIIGSGTMRNNLVSGNLGFGIYVFDVSTTVAGNLVGTDDEGDQPLGNGGTGIFVGDNNATVNGNVVSANGQYGIWLYGSFSNVVTNNTVGLSRLRAHLGLGNGSFGIYVSDGGVGGGNGHRIGLPGNGNVVAASGGGNAAGIVIADGNVSVIWVQGNTVGLDASGNPAPNQHGIYVGNISGTGPVGVDVGGTESGEGNVVSGNNLYGVVLRADNGTDVFGNTIGLDAAGDARPNGAGGISISDNSTGSWVRANVIAGNGGNGIEIGLTSASNAVLTANTIGLNATGAARPNAAVGIFVGPDAPNLRIGGASMGDVNVVSGNAGSGIQISAVGTLVENNRVGTDAAGTAARPNGLSGVAVVGGSGTTIRGNVLSANAFSGLDLNGTTGVVAEANTIGTNAAGDDLGNGQAGVSCFNTTSSRIGTTTAGSGNTIAFNGGDGVSIGDDCDDIALFRNAIYDNDGLGIDLAPDGVTPNDPDDADGGANQLTNFPVVTSVVNDGTTASLTFSLDALATQQYFVDFFTSPTTDPTGFGEGQTFRAAVNVETDANGQVSVTVPLPASEFPVGAWVTATATPVDGGPPTVYRGTSEFSAAIQVVSAGGPLVDLTLTPTNPPPPVTIHRGERLRYRADFAIAAGGPSQFQYWAEATLPNNQIRFLFGPVTVNGTPGTTVTRNLQQRVPNGAPLGNYVFRMKVGTYPNTVLDEDSFPITVIAAEAVVGRGEASADASADDWLAWDADGTVLEAGLVQDLRVGIEAAALAPAASTSAGTSPTTLALHAAHPNPFAATTMLRYDVPEASRVRLSVYDALGREVARLVDGEMEPGWHEAVLDGRGLSSGVYLIRLEAGERVRTHRITLVR